MCGDVAAVIYMTKAPTRAQRNLQERLYLKCRNVPDDVRQVWLSHPEHENPHAGGHDDGEQEAWSRWNARKASKDQTETPGYIS